MSRAQVVVPATYRLWAPDVDAVICHRSSQGREQYLVRWKGGRSSAVLSWHFLPDLSHCLHLVQKYVEARRSSSHTSQDASQQRDMTYNRKRKAPHDELQASLLTPSSMSRASSVSSAESLRPSQLHAHSSSGPDIYNGILQRKGGFIYAKRVSSNKVQRVDAVKIPTEAMLQEATNVTTTNADMQIRVKFLRRLDALPGPRVSFVNVNDPTTPSLDFEFIQENEIGEGVEVPPDELIVGCEKCRPDMGQNRGCEYTQKCDCLEFAAVDEARLNDEQRALFEARKKAGEDDTAGLPKRFPYLSTGQHAGCLVNFYLDQRHIIYECNGRCNCGPKCKNRNVQHGRQVELEIFKTPHPFFGLRCKQDLLKGQFIDIYVGEVITNAETDRREADSGPGKASYLFTLDKNVGAIALEDCYTIDGEKKSGPTRFMNHSCDPNCGVYTVSYNKFDYKMLTLALFAKEDIPAGTELTFDYMDRDDMEEDETQTADDAYPGAKTKCLCGSERCRGYLWV